MLEEEERAGRAVADGHATQHPLAFLQQRQAQVVVVDNMVVPTRPEHGRKPVRFKQGAPSLLGQAPPLSHFFATSAKPAGDLRGPELGEVDFDEWVMLGYRHSRAR